MGRGTHVADVVGPERELGGHAALEFPLSLGDLLQLHHARVSLGPEHLQVNVRVRASVLHGARLDRHAVVDDCRGKIKTNTKLLLFSLQLP